MRYVSTRGGMDPVTFRDAVIIGQAPDGGLLLPEVLPDVSKELEGWRQLSFEDLAFEVIRLFDDIDDAVLRKILQDAFATFTVEDTIPLVQFDGLNVLELFHGPTLAFKDVALQVLGGLYHTDITQTFNMFRDFIKRIHPSNSGVVGLKPGGLFPS